MHTKSFTNRIVQLAILALLAIPATAGAETTKLKFPVRARAFVYNLPLVKGALAKRVAGAVRSREGNNGVVFVENHGYDANKKQIIFRTSGSRNPHLYVYAGNRQHRPPLKYMVTAHRVGVPSMLGALVGIRPPLDFKRLK